MKNFSDLIYRLLLLIFMVFLLAGCAHKYEPYREYLTASDASIEDEKIIICSSTPFDIKIDPVIRQIGDDIDINFNDSYQVPVERIRLLKYENRPIYRGIEIAKQEFEEETSGGNSVCFGPAYYIGSSLTREIDKSSYAYAITGNSGDGVKFDALTVENLDPVWINYPVGNFKNMAALINHPFPSRLL